MGYYCDGSSSGTAKAACAAGTANKYVGATASTNYCATCDNGKTSYAGAEICTLEPVITDCPNGQEWDDSAFACVDCRAGTYRAAGTANQCQECPMGEYSGAKATACSKCPAGQYNPSTGLADQKLFGSAIECLACPKGSIAAASSTATPAVGASTCTAW